MAINIPTPDANETLDEEQMSRRRFLGGMSLLLGGMAAALVGIPIVGFLFSPLVRQPPEEWRTVGQVDDFAIGTTTEVSYTDASPLPWSGSTAQTAAWLRRNSQTDFVAFTVSCTHLGCPVRWLPNAELFMCPCHGGVYYRDGEVAAGPPPKSLPRYPVRVQNGLVQIRTSPLPIT